MAETMDFDQSGLAQVANAVSGDISGGAQKRKREEDASADSARRAGKRVSPHSGEAGDHSGNGDPEAALQEYTLQQQSADGQNGGDHTAASTTAAAALGIFPTMTIPQPTDVAFAAQNPDSERDADASFMDNSQAEDSFMDSGSAEPRTGRGSGSKPAVGSEEWHKVRKDNHKEGKRITFRFSTDRILLTYPVERRRRETINEGISELSKIVPGCEKNKGSILQRAVSFITQLKENEAQNIEKWTLEKLLTEQAIAELSASNDKLKAECERAWREVETWKKTCQSAGLAPKKEDGSSEN